MFLFVTAWAMFPNIADILTNESQTYFTLKTFTVYFIIYKSVLKYIKVKTFSCFTK